LLSIQMVYQNGTVGYYENNHKVDSKAEPIVSDKSEIVNDLKKIGFKNIRTFIRPLWIHDSFCKNRDWIYVKAEK